MSRAASVAAMLAGCGLLGGAAIAQLPNYVKRTTAPDNVRAVGPLHFMGLGVYADGVFVDPASMRREGDMAEAEVLTVRGELWHVAEGDIRWTWGTVKANCAAGTLNREISDHYADDGVWVAGLDEPGGAGDKPDIPVEEGLLGYLCEGRQPADFQVVPTKDSAVAGIVSAFANR